ncbi:unnamed protein product, partial [marine sediment metagenome]
LFDNGIGHRLIRKLKREFKIQKTYLSHWHEDHVSGCALFKKHEYYCHNLDIPPLRDLDLFIDLYGVKGTPAEKEFYPIMQFLKIEPLNDIKIIRDNDLIPIKDDLSVRVIHTPGDFGKEIFLESVDKLHSRGFNVFGWDEQPYWDINKDLRVTAATAWSNQKMDYVFMLKNAGQYVKKNVFNLFYPHWGYELELYPRPKTVEEGKKWIKKFDAIIGTHSHVPQAVTAVESENNNGINKLIAYSLGDFCIEEKLKHYHYGIVLKIGIGQNNAGIWQIGLIEWHFTCCKSLSETECITTIVPKFPYLK